METLGPVAAILSPVSLDVFQGSGAEIRLQDSSWITPRAVRHEQVIEAVMQAAPVFPASSGTIFSFPAKLLETIHQNSKQIISFLNKIQDKDEFSLKAYLDLAVLKKHIAENKVNQEASRLAKLSPGKRYFVEKHIRQDTDTELSRCLSELFNELKISLDDCTVHYLSRSVLSRKASGKEADMVSNTACLVLKKEQGTFQERCKTIEKFYEKLGLEIEISGPWPPCSFCPPLQTQQGGYSF